MRNRRTLATKQNRQVPQLRHVKRLEDLSLIARSVTIQRNRDILIPIVLVREGEPSADGHLRTDDAVATVEALGEHVHGAALAVGDALAAAQELADDLLDAGAAHQGVAVAAVGRDDVVLFGDCVLNARRDGFLARGEMAEAPDLLLLVESVGGHFHAAGGC